jgi:hypothetical protein
MATYIALVHRDEGTSYGVSFPDVISGKSMTELQSAMLACRRDCLEHLCPTSLMSERQNSGRLG